MPPQITRLTDLDILDVRRNKLTVLSPDVGRLTRLHALDLSDNQLTALPSEFGQLVSLQQLDLDGNPLDKPLPDLVDQGIPALLAHLQSLAEEEQTPHHPES